MGLPGQSHQCVETRIALIDKMKGPDRRLTDLVLPATREEEVGLVQEVANDELAQLSLALDQRVVKSVIGGRLREEIIVSRTLDRLWALLPGLACGTAQQSHRDERKAVVSGVELEAYGVHRRVSEIETHAVVELRELARSDDKERLRRRLRGYTEVLAEGWRESLSEGLLAEIESAARADDSEVGATLLALVALARGDAGSLIELALGQQSIGPIVTQLLWRLARRDTSSRNGPGWSRRHALPTAGTVSAVVSATIEDEDDLCLEGTAAACDGAFIYVYRRFSYAKDATVSTETLVKLGTGLYETVAGRIYGRLEFGPTKVTGTVLNSDGCFPAPVEFKRPPHVATPSEADSIDLVCVPCAELLVLCVSGAILAFSTRTLMPPNKLEVPERLWVNAQEDEEKEEKTSDESKQHDKAFVRRRRRRLVGDGCEAMVADFEDTNEDPSGAYIRLSRLVVRSGRLEVTRAMRSIEATLETRAALAAASPAALVGSGALLVLSGAWIEDNDEVPSPNSSCDSLEKRRKRRRRPQGVAMRVVENGEEEEEDWTLGLADCRASFGLDDRREVNSRDISLSADSENEGHPVRNLLREDGGSWQSNGREPHRVHVQFPLVDEEKIWSRIEVRPGTMRPSLFVPKRITVFAGLKQPDQDDDTLQEYRTVTINIHDSGQTSAWHEILTRDELFAKLPCAAHLESPDDKRIVVARIEFRSQGINCKVRGLRIVREERAYRRLLWNAYPSPTGCRILTGLRALDLLAETNAPPVALAADRVNRAVWTYDGKTTCCRWLEPVLPRDVDLPDDGARKEGTLLGALASLACASADFNEPFGPDATLRADRRHAVVELHDGAVATLTLDGMPAAIDELAPSAKFPSFAAVLTIDRSTRRIVSAVMDTSRTNTTHRGLLESELEDSDQVSPRFIKIVIANSAARDPAKGGALSSMRARHALSRLLAKQRRTSKATSSRSTTNGHGDVSMAFPESATSGFAAAVLYGPAEKQGGLPRKETVVAWLGARRAAKLVVSLGPRGLAPGVLDACTDLTPRVFHKLNSKLLADSSSNKDDRTAAAWLLAAANERLSDAMDVNASIFWPKETSESVIDAALHNRIDFAAAGALIASIEKALPAGPLKLAVLDKNLSAAQAIHGLASSPSGMQRQPTTFVSLKDVELWQSLTIEEARRLRTAVAHVCGKGINTSLFLDVLRAATLARAIVAARRDDATVSQALDLALCLEELSSAVNAARSQPGAGDWDNTRIVHVLVATAVVVVAYGSTWAADVRQCFATAADNVSTLFASNAVSSSIAGGKKGDGNNPLDTALCDLDLALVAAAANSCTTAEQTLPAQRQLSAGVQDALSSRLFQGEIVEPIPGSDIATIRTILSKELARMIREGSSDSRLCPGEATTLRLFEVVEDAAAEVSGEGKIDIDQHSVRGRSMIRARHATAAALMYHLNLGADFVSMANGNGIPVSIRLTYAWLASARILRENKRLANEQPESVVARESLAVAERAALLLTLGVHPASTAAATCSEGPPVTFKPESSSIPEAKTATSGNLGTATSLTLWHRDAGGLQAGAQGTHIMSQLTLPRPLLPIAGSSNQPVPAPFSPSSTPKVSAANQAGSGSDKAVLDADVVSDVIAFLANPDLSVPALERERDHRAALAFSRCEALHTIAKQLRTRCGVALTNVVVLATAALRGHTFAPSKDVIYLAQPHEKRTAGVERHASFAHAEAQMRKNSNVTSPAHYTANTLGASRNMSGKLRAATSEVIVALLDLIRPSGTPRCCDNVTNIKVCALRALTLDYIASPVADDVMLANSGLAEILEELRDERRRNERSVVAAARDLAAQLLTPERPSTKLTRSLLTVTRHALHRQANVAVALSKAVVPSEVNAITGTMPLEPSEDGGFLVAPTSKISNQVLASHKPKAIVISLWLCRASSGLVFAALQSAATFSSPSNLQAEVALLFDEHGRLRWTERTQTGTISYAWRYWASPGDWTHVAVVLKEKLELGRGHCVELYLDGAKVEPAAVSSDRDNAVPRVLFSSSSMAAQCPQKYQSLFRMADCLVHAVWAVGNIQGVPATEATACVGAISRLEIAACESDPAVTTLIGERSAKRPFYAAETADLARINYDVLGDALRILRSRSRSSDVLPSMLESLANIADSAFAPVTARVAALRSLANVMPNVAANDPSLLPEWEFFLRRLEDVGNSVVGPLNAASEAPNLGNAIIRVGSDSLAAIAAASKTFIISVSQAAPTGPAYLSKAVKTALATAQLEAVPPYGRNTARVAGAFMLFGETPPRPLVGSRVTLTIPTTNSADVDAFMQHSGMSGLLIARRNKVGFDVERLERERLALRGSTAESQLQDSFPTSLRIFGASTEDESTVACPTEESSPELAQTPPARPPESPDASPTTAEGLADVDVVDVSAPPVDRGRILDPLEALVRGLMDQEDDDNEDDEEGALGSLGAQLQALTDFVDGRRGAEDGENVEDENDGDALEEFGLPARSHRQVFGIRHPDMPTPSLRITNVSLRQRLRRRFRSDSNTDRNIAQVPPPPQAATSPRSRAVSFQEPTESASVSSSEYHADYMVAVAIPKDPTTSMGKDAILQRSGNQYEVCCVPASFVSPAPEYFASSGMATFALHDDKDHGLIDYASFLVNAVATVLRNTKVPSLPSPIADVPLLGQDRTVESQHDHPVGVSTYQTIQFPGATRITISFSTSCATDSSAYLRFYKSNAHSTYWGLAKYSGIAGSSCWTQDLVIPSDTVIVHFNSEESSNSAWGYAMKVKPGFNENWYSYIPPLDPLSVHSVILTSVAVRALDSLLTSPMKYMFADACVSSLAAPKVGFLNTLTRVYANCQAIVENHDDRVRLWQRAVTAPVVCESLHDYANNTNETDMIDVPGASALIVTFDAQSVTEEGHDYLAFYLDAECNRRVPGSEEKYSGSGNRWPGVADSEPLRIPCGRFWYRWVTDGSHTYWGWRMTVTPVVPSHLDDMICGNVHRADALCALIAASPALIPRSEDTPSFEEAPDFLHSDSKMDPMSDKLGGFDWEACLRRAPQREPLPLIAGADTLSKSSSPGRRWEVIHSVGPVDVHAMPSLNSACIATLSRGTVVVELSQSGCWIAHEQGWSLAKNGSTSLLRLLPRSPINLAARCYGNRAQNQGKVATGLSIVALNAPAHADLGLSSQSAFVFEAVVLQAGSLHAVGFTLSPSSTSMEKLLSSWQSHLEEKAKHRVLSSTPRPGTAGLKSVGANYVEEDDLPITNDEGAPAIPSQHIDGLWYCGRRLGTEAMQNDSGQCGPNDGVPCPSCARYTRARHASIAEKAARQLLASTSVTLRMRLQSGETGTVLSYRQLSPANSWEGTTEQRRSALSVPRLVDVANGVSTVWRLMPTAAQACCVNGHDLSPVESRETFTCNGISEPCWWCRSPAGGPSSRSIRWECARCNFYYCHACYESKLRQPAYKISLASNDGTLSYLCVSGDGVALEPKGDETGEHLSPGPTTWTLLPGFTSCTYAIALSQHPSQQRVLCYDGVELRMKSLLEVQPQEEVSWQIEPVDDEEARSSSLAAPATLCSGGEAVRDFDFVGHFGTVLASDVISFRLDISNRQCTISRNGSHVQRSTIATTATCGENLKVVPAFISGRPEAHGILLAWNFGQQPFRHCSADDTPLIGALGYSAPNMRRDTHHEVRNGRSVFTFSCYNRHIDTSSEQQMKERVLGPPKVLGGERNTWDPTSIDPANVALEDGNLRVVATYSRSDRGNRNHVIRARHGYSKARHRWKITCMQREGEGSGHLLGVCRGNAQTTFVQHNCGEGFYGILLSGNNKVSGRGRQSYGRFSHEVGTVYGVDLDLERGTLSFTCNGTDQGVAFTGLGGVFFPALAVGTIESTTYVADFSGANLPLRIESDMLESSACSAGVLMHYSESPVQGLATVGPDWTSDPSKNPLYTCALSDDSKASEEQPTCRALCADLRQAHSQRCITPLPRLLESGVGSVRVAAATLATRHLLTITQLSLQSVLRSLMTTSPTATRPASWGSTRAFLNALVVSVGTASSLEHWPGQQGKGTKGLRAKLLTRTCISAEQDEEACAAFVRHVVSTYTRFVNYSNITGGVSFSVTPHVVNVGHESIQPSLVARVPPLPPSVSGEISTATLPVGDAIAVLDHTTICHTLADGTSRSVNSYRASVNQSSNCYWYNDYSDELPADRRCLMPVYPERDLAGGVNAVLRRCSGWVSFLRYMGADAAENIAKNDDLMTDSCMQMQSPNTAASQSSHATASLCMETLALVMQAFNSNNCALRFLEKDEGAYLLSALSEFVVRAENLQLVESLHGITQALRTIASLEPEAVPDFHNQLHCLESALVSRTNARIQAEVGSNRKSVLLQMLVEAALAAYAAVRRLHTSDESNKNIGERSPVIGGMTESKGDGDQGHTFPIWSEVGLDPRLELLHMKSQVQFKSSSGGMREEIIQVEVSTKRIEGFLEAADDCFVISGDRNAVTLHESALAVVAEEDVRVRTRASFSDTYDCEVNRVEARVEAGGTLVVWFEAQGDGYYGSFLDIDVPLGSVLTVGGEVISTEAMVTYSTRESTAVRGSITWTGVGVDRLLDQKQVEFCFLGVYAQCSLSIPYLSPFSAANLNVTDRLVGIDHDSVNDIDLSSSDELEDFLHQRLAKLEDTCSKLTFFFARTQPVSRQSFATVHGARTVPSGSHFRRHSWRIETRHAGGTIIVGVDSSRGGEGHAANTPVGMVSGVGLGSDGILRACGKEVPFGPGLVAGDFIDVVVDFVDGTVAFWWNGCKIGIGVGPADTQAAIIVSSLPSALGEGEVSIAASLCAAGDAVVLEHDGHPVDSGEHNVDHEPASRKFIIPGWLEEASLVEKLLSDIDTQHADDTLLFASPAGDAAIVEWLDRRSTTQTDEHLRKGNWSAAWISIKPTDDQLIAAPPALRLMNSQATSHDVEARLAVIDRINRALERILPLMPWGLKMPLAAAAARHRRLVYAAKKKALLDECVHATISHDSANSNLANLELVRQEIADRIERRECDEEGKWSTFGRAFRVLTESKKLSYFRKTGRLFRVQLRGEHALDDGGPYREMLSTFASELQSKTLPLLIQTPNAVADTGENRDRYIVRPGAAANPTHRSMLEFFGRLMGFSLRNCEFLALSLAPVVWKILVDEPLDEVYDLASIDKYTTDALNVISSCTKEEFDRSFTGLCFTYPSADNSEPNFLELVPDGANKEVMYADRDEFVRAALAMRVAELKEAVVPVRIGLAQTVPQIVLSLYTGRQLETKICGEVSIDLQLLKRCTVYEDGYSATDRHVSDFWQILEEMDHTERANFLRFTWGRTRLPLTSAEFPDKFKIARLPPARGPVDTYLPSASTCHFRLYLPPYSNRDVMRAKLRQAIHDCHDIDNDV